MFLNYHNLVIINLNFAFFSSFFYFQHFNYFKVSIWQASIRDSTLVCTKLNFLKKETIFYHFFIFNLSSFALIMR